MGSEKPEGVMRGHTEAWAELLEAHRPDAAEEQGAAPSFWSLLRAARCEPFLGAMHPWISMRQLSLSASDSWEDWGHEPLPALFARPDTYAVVSRSDRGGPVTFETADPAEAVAYAAGLIRERAGSPREQPYVRTTEVDDVLRRAGWRPGRSIDTTVWRELLEADGFRLHAAAEGFLREFGGLTVGRHGSGITRAREAFDLDPLLALGESERFAEYGEEMHRCLCPVGELGQGHAFLGMDERGELYALTGRPARFGRMPEALENLVLGVMPVRRPDAAPRGGRSPGSYGQG
ncbi:SUKH-3 domain-containing protein [Streptomyces sp. NPDC018038]